MLQTEERRRGEIRLARYHIGKMQERIRKIVRYRRIRKLRKLGVVQNVEESKPHISSKV